MPAPSRAADRAALAAAAARSRAAAKAFRTSDAWRTLSDHVATANPADMDALVEAATALLTDTSWVASLLAPLLDALAAEPWLDLPLRVYRDALRVGAVLFEAPAMTLSATVLSADVLAAASRPTSVIIPGRLALTRYVRAGGAVLRRWRAEPADESFTAAGAAPCVALPPHHLADGDLVLLDGRTTGHLLEAARADVVMLSATINAGAAPFMREYDCASGALKRVAMLDEGAARSEMLLAYLRLCGRADARDCFEAATREGAFFLRWSAMREWLATDVRAALPRLREMTADPHGDVRSAAAATLPRAELACRA